MQGRASIGVEETVQINLSRMVAASGASTPQIGSVIFQLGGHHGEISVWIVYGTERIKKVRTLSRREGRGGDGGKEGGR